MIGRNPLKYILSFQRLRFFVCLILLVSLNLILYLTLLPRSSPQYVEPVVRGWDRSRSRDIPLYIQPNRKTVLIEPTTICKEDKPILLLIMVSSAVNNFHKSNFLSQNWRRNLHEIDMIELYGRHNLYHIHRQTIRKTWGNTTEFNYSKFSEMHRKLPGYYLPIDHPDWKKFIVKNELSSPSAVEKNYGSLDNEPSQANFHIRVAFLLGQTEYDWLHSDIIRESRKYDDIIQENIIDSYNNLTLKSVMMLKWMTNNCNGKVKFLMKCDDDTFVNVPNLVHILLGGTVPIYAETFHSRLNQSFVNSTFMFIKTDTMPNGYHLEHFDNLLIGHGLFNHTPIRDSNNKWYAPKYMFGETTYPRYLSGACYVFTMDTAQALYNVSMDVPLFHMEDVYITGICAEEAHIERLHHPLFLHPEPYDLCVLRYFVYSHALNDMKAAYQFVINTNETCDKESGRTTARPRVVSYM